MKLSIKIYCLLIFSITIFSCKKFLDVKPNNQVSTPTTLEDLQALLDNSSVMNIGVTPNTPDASADDYFIPEDIYNSLSTLDQSVYTWTPYVYTFPNDWSINYAPVYNSNLCLEQVAKIERNESNKQLWDNVKGSSLFFRSYYFLQLIWEYGKAYNDATSGNDLGIALRVSSDQNVRSVRASVKECYEKIIADTKEALIYLSGSPAHIYRPSKAGAFGLLARTYLSMRKYDEARKWADSCLSLNNQILDYNSANVDPSADYPFTNNNNNEIIFYTEMDIILNNIVDGIANVDTTLYASYSDYDLRKTVFFKDNSPYHIYKGTYSGYLFYFTGISTDEMLLIKSECLARAGNVNSALTTLNTLMVNRWDPSNWTPITAIDANDALDKILIERRKELIYRGLRWMI